MISLIVATIAYPIVVFVLWYFVSDSALELIDHIIYDP